ncbi:MAG: G5 domain-containing protein [Candidatus Daviesbacteria bacterium]|nr:G5 domain-containing protein [Candidatus Daviesbacteria bacterium]
MMKTLIGAFLVLTALFIHFYLPSLKPEPIQVEATQEVAGITSESTDWQTLPPIKTQSRFEEKLLEDAEVIKKKTVFKDDPEIEAGTDTVLEEGLDGKKTTITKITYYEGKEYSREIVGTEITEAKDKIISRGTKIVWKILQTPDGEIKYWKKMRVYATHYDSHCPGCDEWTSIGMKQGKGVIAVDPKVIKYRTRLYVPGYGPAVAGDTGGAIKGNIIDLGFEDAKTAGWKAKFVDIYLID